MSGDFSRSAPRKRVAKACNRCRNKRDKCDGEWPCASCRDAGEQCSYDPSTKKRGLPEGYVRGLEKLWVLSICRIDGLEDSVLRMLETNGGEPFWRDEKSPDYFHEQWKASRLFGALEQLLLCRQNPTFEPSKPTTKSRSGLVKRRRTKPVREKRMPRRSNTMRASPLSSTSGSSEEIHQSKEATPDGSTNGSPPILQLPPAIRARELSVPLRINISPSNHTMGVGGIPEELNQSEESTFDRSTVETLPLLELPPNTTELIDFFFMTTTDWLPIIAKDEFQRIFFLSADDPVCITSSSTEFGYQATLWAILSYAAAQYQYQKPYSESTKRVEAAKKYLELSRNLLPTEKDQYKIQHVGVILLLSLVSIGMGDWNAAHDLSCLAADMIMRTMSKPFGNANSAVKFIESKAVFFGCFVLDSILSFRLSRSPRMSSDDLAVVELHHEVLLNKHKSWDCGALLSIKSQNECSIEAITSLFPDNFSCLIELALFLHRCSQDPIFCCNETSFWNLVQNFQQTYLSLRVSGPQFDSETQLAGKNSSRIPDQSLLGIASVARLLHFHFCLIVTKQEPFEKPNSMTEEIKGLLAQGLTIISDHLDHYSPCGTSPLFEPCLWIMIEHALVLCDTVELSDPFPFFQWIEKCKQKMNLLGMTWPVFRNLVGSIENWQWSRSFANYQSFLAADIPVHS